MSYGWDNTISGAKLILGVSGSLPDLLSSAGVIKSIANCIWCTCKCGNRHAC